MSAYTSLERKFDFNKHTTLPSRIKSGNSRKERYKNNLGTIWVRGWYIGTDIDHYRVHHIYVNTTRAERVGYTVEFLPHHTNMLSISSADRAALAVVDLTEELPHPNPEALFAKIGKT